MSDATTYYRWSIADLADALEAGLRGAAAALDAEQAVHGLDARDELELHPTIAATLEAAGYGVHREERYPADRRKRRESEGERCDLVLTPDGRPLERPEASDTLFRDPTAVELEDAFWLEVKAVAQFHVEGPNDRYSAQLLAPVRQDVTKLSKDDGILHAGLLIVLFTRDDATAAHDLGIWQDKCLERGLPISAPSVRRFPIVDRLGNGVCTVVVYGVAHL